MSELRLGMSQLTGTIFAGRPLKSGLWSSKKQDVTQDALVMVALHVLRNGEPVDIRNDAGKVVFRISVERI